MSLVIRCEVGSLDKVAHVDSRKYHLTVGFLKNEIDKGVDIGIIESENLLEVDKAGERQIYYEFGVVIDSVSNRVIEKACRRANEPVIKSASVCFNVKTLKVELNSYLDSDAVDYVLKAVHRKMIEHVRYNLAYLLHGFIFQLVDKYKKRFDKSSRHIGG